MNPHHSIVGRDSVLGEKRGSPMERVRSPMKAGLPAQAMPTRRLPEGGSRCFHLLMRSLEADKYGTLAGIVSSLVLNASGRLSSGQ